MFVYCIIFDFTYLKKSYDVLTSLKNWIIFYWLNEKQKWTIHENNSKPITIMSEQFMKNKNYYYNVGTIHEKQKLLL